MWGKDVVNVDRVLQTSQRYDRTQSLDNGVPSSNGHRRCRVSIIPALDPFLCDYSQRRTTCSVRLRVPVRLSVTLGDRYDATGLGLAARRDRSLGLAPAWTLRPPTGAEG
ncbi:hypothetical protein BQ8482_40031 [Mesorhizobium delmotii]|uniref:Uncharacterized protein n=1 Tax=Mesorhizobium delmotii TaxID=1631247 RepID=A0A2P9ASV2_9HYPH|nr:hypothetical protein BQ8482_40031 [Mesorhizobium delmotii]